MRKTGDEIYLTTLEVKIMSVFINSGFQKDSDVIESLTSLIDKLKGNDDKKKKG